MNHMLLHRCKPSLIHEGMLLSWSPQSIMFIGTRFAQYLLLQALEQGQGPPFRTSDAEQTWWQRCLNAVTVHSHRTELDQIFEDEFRPLLPDGWEPVEGKGIGLQITVARNQVMTNAKTMMATTFHRRIRECLKLVLLTSRVLLRVALDKADGQLCSKLTEVITKKQEWEPLVPNDEVYEGLRQLLTSLAAAMVPLPELNGPRDVRGDFFNFLNVLHLVQKTREGCHDSLSPEQREKLPRVLKKSMALLPLSSPSVPAISITPSILKIYHNSFVRTEMKGRPRHEIQTELADFEAMSNEARFQLYFPQLADFKRGDWTFANHIKTDGYSASVLFSHPKPETEAEAVKKVFRPSTGTYLTVEGVDMKSVNPPVTPEVG